MLVVGPASLCYLNFERTSDTLGDASTYLSIIMLYAFSEVVSLASFFRPPICFSCDVSSTYWSTRALEWARFPVAFNTMPIKRGENLCFSLIAFICFVPFLPEIQNPLSFLELSLYFPVASSSYPIQAKKKGGKRGVPPTTVIDIPIKWKAEDFQTL
ncbi:hypothetical protein Hanom_Chr09g00835701 [Helianthus anomalus]